MLIAPARHAFVADASPSSTAFTESTFTESSLASAKSEAGSSSTRGEAGAPRTSTSPASRRPRKERPLACASATPAAIWKHTSFFAASPASASGVPARIERSVCRRSNALSAATSTARRRRSRFAVFSFFVSSRISTAPTIRAMCRTTPGRDGRVVFALPTASEGSRASPNAPSRTKERSFFEKASGRKKRPVFAKDVSSWISGASAASVRATRADAAEPPTAVAISSRGLVSSRSKRIPEKASGTRSSRFPSAPAPRRPTRLFSPSTSRAPSGALGSAGRSTPSSAR